MSLIKTRKKVNCPIFGAPRDLPLVQLPTYSDVMKCYLLIRSELKPNINSKEPNFAEICKTLVPRITEIWNKVSLPVVTQKRVLCILRAYHEKYRNLMKPYKARKNNESYIEKIHTFQVDSKKLFDICSCKCKDIDDCKCKKSSRVNKNEVDFLTDQRTMRTMFIGGVDMITTLKEQKKQDRKQKDLSRLTVQNFQKHSRSQSQMSIHSLSQSEMSMECSSPVSTASSFSPDAKLKKCDENPLKQMRISLPSLAIACDRSGVSDRSAALIASSVLTDVGIITSADQSQVRRERAKMRSLLQQASTEESILGLYFDGRKDKTLVSTKKGTKYYKKFEIEDHYVIVIEPRSTYFGHVTCQQGTSKIIKHEIFTYCMNKNVDLSNLSVIGCDGTVINTGSKGGVICLLEETLNKPLHWFICQLHSNELPLRHLLLYLDGKMTGPRCFSGQIGKQLQECQKLPVVIFKVIPTTIPIIFSKDLSNIFTKQ